MPTEEVMNAAMQACIAMYNRASAEAVTALYTDDATLHHQDKSHRGVPLVLCLRRRPRRASARPRERQRLAQQDQLLPPRAV